MSRGPRPHAAPDWGSDDTGCTVLHVDMDCFFASVELLHRPELRGKPLIVGGSDQRGVVTSATYEARTYGVHAAMPIGQARRLCPSAVVVPNRKGEYARVSGQVMSILAEVTPDMEQVSIDEAYLDVRGSLRRMGRPTDIARWIRREVATRVGVPASVGIAAVTHVAKLASSFAKPDGLLLIPAAATQEFMRTLPFAALPGVGQSSQERAARYGLECAGDITQIPPQRLAHWLGQAQSRHLLRLVAGEEVRGIHPHRQEKSQGTEETFATNLHDRDEIGNRLLAQSHATARRLRQAGLVGATVVIKVRFADFTTITRSRSLPQPTDVGGQIAATALALFDKITLPAGGVRLVGTRVEGLRPRSGGVQLAFDDDGRSRAAETAADAVAKRFGEGVIKPARLV